MNAEHTIIIIKKNFPQRQYKIHAGKRTPTEGGSKMQSKSKVRGN